VGSGADTSFGTQSTCVLPVPGRADTFIFMADRWKQWDLADSRYVWLPLEFAPDGRPVLRWLGQWSPNSSAPSNGAPIMGKTGVSTRLQ